ncbi:hypothetical protein NicSoilB4_34650 [Arthrobacter sp. NicSoilB4]|uniref:DUF4389 domain-containing protein n=1 Tax=Arthrobacter sp. NicSoilB4 TaxID=2830997 RepID=UPI001CC618C5|nr:DUF4389 domain-containing protein [Arthrobacter sp. NicSoilB4]BCW68702.1 hypothetical protein NicSoilB4_34650 [Arthrobacter sp. NicSoilB4]
MRPGRIVMLVLGTLSALLGLGLLAGSGAVGWANYQQRDNGFFTTPVQRFGANSYALTSPRLDIMTESSFPETAPVVVPGSILLRGSAADPTKAVFIGIAPQAEVAAYMAGVHHSEIVDVRFRPFRTLYRDVAGPGVPAPPADQSFWTALATGQGTQELRWDLRPGSWAVVIMNADATTPVAVDLQAGARSDLLWPVFIGLLVGGIVLLLIGLPLIIFGAAGLGRGKGGPPAGPGQPSQPYAGQSAPGQRSYAAQPYTAGAVPGIPPGAGPGTLPGAAPVAAAGIPPGAGVVYPARLSGYLDPDLSRWMWLVKWFLAIPHFIVLFFLWFAFGVVTIVAWFAILFTGHYPRSLFNFNVGVIRWSWRVAFYCYAALGTDRYPPFTLERTDYPADFDVDYPEKLSHGLVLVKSWLLALPHLLIIALLTGTAQTWVYSEGEWSQVGAGMSLFGLLVFIAGVILLFTGVYSRGLFDFLMGLNRWIYRVTAYVALMRDEYPPFHLDMGPRDPGDAAMIPPAMAPAGPGYAPLPDGPGGTPNAGQPPYSGQPGPGGTAPATPGPGAGQAGFYGIGGPAAAGPDRSAAGAGPGTPEPPAGPEGTAGPDNPAGPNGTSVPPRA